MRPTRTLSLFTVVAALLASSSAIATASNTLHHTSRSRAEIQRDRALRAEFQRLEALHAEAARVDRQLLLIESAGTPALDAERRASAATAREQLDDASLAAREDRARIAAERRRYRALIAQAPKPSDEGYGAYASPLRPHRNVRGGGPTVWGWHYPRVIVGFGAGVGGFARDMSAAAFVGPSWHAMIGVDLNDWLGLDARYFGQYNDGDNAAVGDGVGVVTNGTYAALRLSAPLRYLQPYAFGGVGVAYTGLVFKSDAQNTPLRRTASGLLPFGAGVNVLLGTRWSVGAEVTYHYTFGATFSDTPQFRQGDFWNAGLDLRVRL